MTGTEGEWNRAETYQEVVGKKARAEPPRAKRIHYDARNGYLSMGRERAEAFISMPRLTGKSSGPIKMLFTTPPFEN